MTKEEHAHAHNLITPNTRRHSLPDDAAADEEIPVYCVIPDELQRILKDFLRLSEIECTAVGTFLVEQLGCQTVVDLGVLEASDFANNYSSSTFSLTLSRKLLLIAEFLQRGGSFVFHNNNNNNTDDDDTTTSTRMQTTPTCMEELLQMVHAARATKTGRILTVGDDTNKRNTKHKNNNKNNSSNNNCNNEVIELNVGGQTFTTTRQTLCSQKDTVLEAMFSGRHPSSALQDSNGVYLIDRPGTYFSYILDYLRCGTVVKLPHSEAARKELCIEADYYGLEHVVHAIQRPKINFEELLPETVRMFRDKEEELRTCFRNRLNSHPHQGLIDLFHPDQEDLVLSLLFEPTKFENCTRLMDIRDNSKAAGAPVIGSSLSVFEFMFNREHSNVLPRLRNILQEEQEVIIAGGSVLRALTSSPGCRTANWFGAKKTDIDLFICNRDPTEATRIAQRIFYALAVYHETWVIVRGRGVINIHSFVGGCIDERVQIVLRLYESPAEVLMGFDCDCCCCAYDGNSVWVSDRWLYAIRKGVNFLNPLHAWPNKASYELRLAKYAYRGFAVVVPGLDTKRIKHRVRTAELRDLKGLARLLKVAYDMEAASERSKFPKPPDSVDYLREYTAAELNPVELLITGRGGYDDVIDNVLLPEVYLPGDWRDDNLQLLWWENTGADFSLAADTRDEAWREIVNGPAESLDAIPDRLQDAWNLEKRSREYLNAAIDSYDRDNIYYEHAYNEDGE